MTLPTAPFVHVIADDELLTTTSGELVVYMTDAAQEQHRFIGAILEIDIDWCQNTFGVAPCTATGTKCYHGYTTCKDKENFHRGTKTLRFGLRGMPASAGDTLRPYLLSVDVAASEIKPGLAIRSLTSCSLTDETDNDTELDPYYADRASPPGGTFWRRFQARHPNVVGRAARIKRGFATTPSGEQFFKVERYIVDSVVGPDQSGKVQIRLTDPIQLLEKATVPKATDGKLLDALPAVAYSGTLAVGGSSSVTFMPGAPVDVGTWDGYELCVVGNVGSGQRAVISNYDGTTLTANLSPELLVPLDTTSRIEIRPLSLTLQAGQGAQYGNSGYVRIGDEVLRFSSRSGDVLSWPSSEYRGQFNTEAADHDADAGVQLCRVYEDQPASAVILDILTTAGVSMSLIDSAQLADEDDTWLRDAARITACLSKPEKCAEALTSLCRDLAVMVYWDPQDQVVRMKANLPQIDGASASYTDDDFINGTVRIDRKDAERLTRCAQWYDLRAATLNTSENKNYARAEIRIDADAESVNEYGDERADIQQSKWLTSANKIHTQALVARRLAAVRDAPHRFTFQLDPRESPKLAALVDCTSRKLTDTEGNARTVRCRVMKLSNEGYHWQVEAQSTAFSGRRYAFIAPAGQADFGAASDDEKRYAYIASSSTAMSDGTAPYLII